MAIKKLTKTSASPAKSTKPAEPTLRVNAEWRNLLIENEGRAKKLTDEQLIAKMQAIFPTKKNKTTILRASMIRSIYNKGTGMFKKFGPAGSKASPRSFAYDAKGNKLEGNSIAIPKSKIKKVVKTVKVKTKPAKIVDDEVVVED